MERKRLKQYRMSIGLILPKIMSFSEVVFKDGVSI